MPATITQINRVAARAALFPFSRSGERFLVRSSRFWRRQPRLLRAWPRSASAGSVQSKSEKRRSGRGDEAGEPGSPFIPPPHVGGYGRLHGSASVASRRHLTGAQPSTPMTLTTVETIRQATKQTPPLTPPNASDTPHPLFLQKSCNQHSAHTVRNAPARSVIAPAWPLPADAKSSAPAASKAASA